jgi:hypothetical protein
MPDPNEEFVEWSELATYPSSSAAEVDAGYLRSEGIAARVTHHQNLPGLPGTSVIWVGQSQIERARWLLKFPPASEAELEFLATGEFPKPKDLE